MSEIDLKEYTSKIVELESSVYTQKKLMGEHEKIIESQKPTEPVMAKIEEPIKPNEPIILSEKLKVPRMVAWILIILMGICSSPFMGMFALVFCPICIAIGVCSIFLEIKEKKNSEKTNTNNRIKYEEQMAAYNQKKANYADEVARVEWTNTNSNTQYQEAMSAYTLDSEKTKRQHAEALAKLEQALQDLYDQNIIYPKYRNMVAMTTINEYLMSGRCSELEGASGAYNLYEMELRQNIIINQMSNIVDNLEGIRNNQFLLYQELTKANQTIDGILDEVRSVNKNTLLTAYFAQLNAKIAAAPRVTVGRIF